MCNPDKILRKKVLSVTLALTFTSMLLLESLVKAMLTAGGLGP